MGCEIVTCGGLRISEVGSEATGVAAGWLGCEIATCGCLSSSEDGVKEVSQVLRAWLLPAAFRHQWRMVLRPQGLLLEWFDG